MSKFKELYESLPNIEWVELTNPSKKEDIELIKSKLGVDLPNDLYNFYLESDGDGCAIFSVSRLVGENCDLRAMAEGVYMPLDCFLFFGDNGCGDYFGYPIIGGEAEQDRIFMWNHDSDERYFICNTLEEFINLYYGDEATGDQVMGKRM